MLNVHVTLLANRCNGQLDLLYSLTCERRYVLNIEMLRCMLRDSSMAILMILCTGSEKPEIFILR